MGPGKEMTQLGPQLINLRFRTVSIQLHLKVRVFSSLIPLISSLASLLSRLVTTEMAMDTLTPGTIRRVI